MAKNKSFNIMDNLNMDLSNFNESPKKQTDKEQIKPVEDGKEKEQKADKEDLSAPQVLETEEVIENKNEIASIQSMLKDPGKKKESKSIRKSFLITPSQSEKLDALAKKREQSVNALLNDILDAILK